MRPVHFSLSINIGWLLASRLLPIAVIGLILSLVACGGIMVDQQWFDFDHGVEAVCRDSDRRQDRVRVGERRRRIDNSRRRR